jgi:hypothetical protein
MQALEPSQHQVSHNSGPISRRPGKLRISLEQARCYGKTTLIMPIFGVAIVTFVAVPRSKCRRQSRTSLRDMSGYTYVAQPVHIPY